MGNFKIFLASIWIIVPRILYGEMLGGHICYETYTERQRYTAKCAFWGWKRCTRYRTIYKQTSFCCEGWDDLDTKYCVYRGPSTASITGTAPVFADGSNSLTLTCVADSDVVTYEWRLRGAVIAGERTNTLTLSPVEPSHNGANVKCTVRCTFDSTHATSNPIILTVYYGPSDVTITGNVPVFADGTSMINVLCTANYNPGIKFQWRDQNGDLSGETNSRFTKIAEQTDNGRTITCHTQNSEHLDRQEETTVTLVVYYEPSDVTITGNVPVIADGTNKINLLCTANYSPGLKFQWRDRDGDLSGETNSRFTKIAEPTDDGRTITCHTQNSEHLDRQKETTVTLVVYYGAKETTIEVASDIPISEGYDVIVDCSCHSNPDPTFKITGPTNALTVDSNRLEINNISRTDAGEYSCTTGNDYFKETKKITLEVRFPPDVTVSYATDGDTGVTLTCQASGIPQTYNFGSWKHITPDRETVIREVQGVQNGDQYTLTLNNVTFEDSGYYECTVNNGVQGRSTQVDQEKISDYLSIEGPPIILERDDYVHSDLGDVVNIEVSFYSVPEYTLVKWYGTNRHLSHTVNATSVQTTFHGESVIVAGYVTTLKFDSVTSDDFLPYRVVVKNMRGSASFVKTLKGIKTMGRGTSANQTSSVTGAVVGTVVGMLVLVAVIVLLLWRRGIISFNERPHLCKKNKEPENVYRNHAFDNQDENQSDTYQQLAPSRTTETLYDDLHNARITPEINGEYETLHVTTEKSQYEQPQKETPRNTDSPKTEDDVVYMNTKLN